MSCNECVLTKYVFRHSLGGNCSLVQEVTITAMTMCTVRLHLKVVQAGALHSMLDYLHNQPASAVGWL